MIFPLLPVATKLAIAISGNFHLAGSYRADCAGPARRNLARCASGDEDFRFVLAEAIHQGLQFCKIGMRVPLPMPLRDSETENDAGLQVQRFLPRFVKTWS